MKRVKIIALNVIAIFASSAVLIAQGPPDPGPIVAGAALMPPPGSKGGMMAMHLENNLDVAPVKDVAFCAAVTTEHTQSFADGNRIHTSESSTLCRDSEGRTRRETGLNLLGAGAQTSAPRLITIDDPVGGVRYLLDSENKIAHKMVLMSPDKLPPNPAAMGAKGERVMIYRSTGGPIPMGADPPALPPPNVFFKQVGRDSNEPAPTTEKLGDETISGIRASGTRMTTTIPSGTMGNDKPIIVTSERWYSTDLSATVMMKHNDPWAGELKTEFTSVNTSEPDPALFTVPSDYKIVDEKSGPVTIRMATPAPPVVP